MKHDKQSMQQADAPSEIRYHQNMNFVVVMSDDLNISMVDAILPRSTGYLGSASHIVIKMKGTQALALYLEPDLAKSRSGICISHMPCVEVCLERQFDSLLRSIHPKP
jgi:hypothetical protein